ncbi:MAG: Fic family protein [Bacteroidota bacterium]|nr:Fic family protein [Bacteroidota bacterium]
MSLSSLQPLIPDSTLLKPKGESIITRAAKLGGGLHPETLQAIVSLLRTVNCYYSNLIEGHDTHPVDIEKAMHKEYSRDKAKRNLQEEALAHIQVQEKMEERLRAEPELNVCSKEFLCWLHKEFYERVPEEFRFVENPQTKKREPVVPGAIRHYNVQVGRHVAPPHERVGELLDHLSEFYRPSKYKGADALIALAASHHRFLWVHPFGDGNGRVMRLATDAYIERAGIAGHGLWMASRGLARSRKQYLDILGAADAERWNDYDGRGSLSQKALTAFCDFFLDVCADQISYMFDILKIDQLALRVREYGKAREGGMLKGRTQQSDIFRHEETLLLENLVYRGTIPRADVPRIVNKEERTARRIVRFLTEEGFIISDSTRAPLRFAIPAYAAPHFFPDLYNPVRTP